MRYSSRVVRRPAAHAPGVRSGRSCHMPATRPGSLPHGQLSAPVGLRMRAYSSPLARSASGRVLSPPYAAIWPAARFTGARVRHASRPASGAHPTRGRPVCYRHSLVRARPVHQPARAAKAHCDGNSAATTRHRHPPPSRSTSSRRPAAPARSRPRAATAPLATPNSPAPQRAPAGSWQPTRCHMPPRTPPHLKTASPDGRRRPSRYNCSCNRPPKARRAPWPCPPPP